MADNMELVTGHSGTPHVSGADAGAMHAGVFGEGAYFLRSKPTAAVGYNFFTLPACDMMLQGRHVRVTGDGETVALEVGETGYYRRDTVYVRYTVDSSTGEELVTLGAVTGTASTTDAGAVAPDVDNPGSILEGSADIVDVPLATVTMDGNNASYEWLLDGMPTMPQIQASVPLVRAGTIVNNPAAARDHFDISPHSLGIEDMGDVTCVFTNGDMMAQDLYLQSMWHRGINAWVIDFISRSTGIKTSVSGPVRVNWMAVKR